MGRIYAVLAEVGWAQAEKTGCTVQGQPVYHFHEP